MIRATITNAISSLREDGYFVCPGFIDVTDAERILEEADNLSLAVNKNDIVPIATGGGQRFLTHCLARSETAVSVITSDFILDLADHMLGDHYRLIGKRIYGTPPDFKMQWHADTDLRRSAPGDCPALTFILYLTDVADGEFELVSRSHFWEGTDEGVKVDESTIDAQHANQVQRFPMKRGGIIIYNARTLHRAHPMRNPNSPMRKSLYFQINRGTDVGEPIVINTAFAKKLDSRRTMLLGFGAPSTVTSFPRSTATLAHWPDDEIHALLQENPERYRRLLG